MKWLLIILIGVSVILQSFSKAIILVNFQFNKEYIAKNLCVQKEVKGNCCQGSCHLKKQLKEEDKQEQSPVTNLKGIRDFQVFCQNNISFQFKLKLFLEREFIPFESSKIVSASFSIFHPPKA